MNVNDFMRTITIGMDPELFIFDRSNNEYVGAAGLVEGTKEEPVDIGDGLKVQKDGLALEFNRGPMSYQEFRNYNFERDDKPRLKAYINRHNRGIDRYRVHAKPAVFFSEAVMEMQDEKDLELGCDPDFSAYTGKANPVPKVYGNYRVAGGHIHIGWTENIDPFDPSHFDMCRVYAHHLTYLTYYIENGSLNAFRHMLYGKPGAFRPKPYGMEFRYPSNAWLGDRYRFTAISDYIRWAVEDSLGTLTPDRIPQFALGKRVASVRDFSNQQINLIKRYGMEDFIRTGNVSTIKTGQVNMIAAE